jgi:hypothetical protein
MASVNNDRVRGVNASLAVKAPCRVRSTANISLAGLQTLDGVLLVEYDRVLVMSQADASENGIYSASDGAWSRTADFDGEYDFTCGTYVIIAEGTLYAGVQYRVSSPVPIELGVDDINFVNLTQDAADDAAVSAASALASENAAEAAETNAELAETNAETAATAAVLANINAGSSADAAAASAAAAAASAATAAAATHKNLLINSGFDIHQADDNLATAADDVYLKDGWYQLISNATATTVQQPAESDGSGNILRVVSSPGAQGLAFAQIIESVDSKYLEAQSLALAFDYKGSVGPLNYAILGWTGTADAVTSDVVNNWASTTYTAGNFFIANIVVIAQGLMPSTGGGFAPVTPITGVVPAGVNNLIVFIWRDPTQVGSLGIQFPMLNVGTSPIPFYRETHSIALARCMRFYEKSFDYGRTPVQNDGTSGACRGILGKAGAVANALCIGQPFKVPKVRTPTMTFYGTGTASALPTDAVTAAAVGANTASLVGENGFSNTYTGVAAGAVGNPCSLHWVANARL